MFNFKDEQVLRAILNRTIIQISMGARTTTTDIVICLSQRDSFHYAFVLHKICIWNEKNVSQCREFRFWKQKSL